MNSILLKKNLAFKLISILLISIIIFFQIIPSMSYEFTDVLKPHSQNSGIIYSTKTLVHSVSSLIPRESVRSIVWKVPYHTISIIVLQIIKQDLFYSYILSQFEPIDLRKVIQQSISNHFTGSKYKVEHFFIWQFR